MATTSSRTATSSQKRKTEPSVRATQTIAKIRLDLAVAQAATVSRERAQALILAGHVKVNGATQRKAGTMVTGGTALEISATERYVSRGAYKLERALEVFGWSVERLRCLDVGASTGGFTDCLLQRGAATVTAVDVGYGHLAWSLRTNPRVIAIERTNFRHADLIELGAPFDFACADVSFISLTKLALQLASALASGGRLIALVKPQFEAGREAVERGGVVRSPDAQVAAIHAVCASFEKAALRCDHLIHSPLKGPAGNIEFLLGATRVGSDGGTGDDVGSPKRAGDDVGSPIHYIEGVVRAAHEALDR